jgi:hypothetical protein
LLGCEGVKLHASNARESTLGEHVLVAELDIIALQGARTFGLLCGTMGCPFMPSVFASFFLANSCIWGCRAVCATAADLLPGAAAGRTKPVAKLKQAMQLTTMEINLISSNW